MKDIRGIKIWKEVLLFTDDVIVYISDTILKIPVGKSIVYEHVHQSSCIQN